MIDTSRIRGISQGESFLARLLGEMSLCIDDRPPKITLDHIDAVMVLSAPSAIVDGKVILKSGENVARIAAGVQVLNQLVATELGRTEHGVTPSDLEAWAPRLILNGDSDQIVMMEEVARELNVPDSIISIIDAGPATGPGAANTRTQFEQFNRIDFGIKIDQLLVVTTNYHEGRVARTAAQNLCRGSDRQNLRVEVLGIPFQDLEGETEQTLAERVAGEIVRIPKYVRQGDLVEELPDWVTLAHLRS